MRSGDFEFEILVEAASGETQDAAGVFPAGHGLLMVVADGAGGIRISGASVGDSEAWLISGAHVNVLTERQKRKPLLGARRAMPTPFFAQLSPDDVVLLGTDGVFKYARREQLRESISDSAPGGLGRVHSLLRLPNGRLQDDIAMILCRRVRASG